MEPSAPPDNVMQSLTASSTNWPLSSRPALLRHQRKLSSVRHQDGEPSLPSRQKKGGREWHLQEISAIGISKGMGRFLVGEIVPSLKRVFLKKYLGFFCKPTESPEPLERAVGESEPSIGWNRYLHRLGLLGIITKITQPQYSSLHLQLGHNEPL